MSLQRAATSTHRLLLAAAGTHARLSFYPPGLRQSAHLHEHAHVSIIIAGAIRERSAGRDERRFRGFMLGTTANSIAVMRTLVERYGPAPRAFLVAPLVGAFFIDFTNALIITGFLNLWG